jgi:hypothetical protein
MARRNFTHETTSRSAIWARRIALFSLAAVSLSIAVLRSGVLEIGPALVTFAAAMALAVIALVLAFSAFVSIWKDGTIGMGAALTAIFIAVLLLSYPAYLGFKARNLPWIYDIVTDPDSPPCHVGKARPRDSNPVACAGLTAAEQMEAYPDIGPLDTNISAPLAYKASLAVVTRRRWPIVEARQPDDGRPEGRIEAVASTPILGFRDDVIVRIKPFEGGARVDIRSSSRYGKFDFGANADRVRHLLEEIAAELSRPTSDETPIARPKAPQKGQPKSSPKGDQPPAKR